MNKNTILTISAIAVVLGGGAAIYFVRKKNADKRAAAKAAAQIAAGGKDAPPASDTQTKGDIGMKVNVHPTEGYTNIRSSAKVDDGAVGSWFGLRLGGNFMGKVESNPVGIIKGVVSGGEGHTWYEIELKTAIDGKKVGYVRQDAISF